MSDDAIIKKISKLLKLADSSKTTEGEAALAAAKVQELLQEYGLSLAEIESRGESHDAGQREKRQIDSFAINYGWQIKLMTTIAETNFVLCRVHLVKTARGRGKRFQLVGRKLNVDATRMVYDYLYQTMYRIAVEQGYAIKDIPGKPGHADPVSMRNRTNWNEGCVDRLAERLRERAEEAKRASAQRAAQGNGTGKELVLSDLYGSEAELNNDLVNGFAPGTTATRRRKAEERQRQFDATLAALEAQGVEHIEAWYRAYGYGEEAAKEASQRYHRRESRRWSGRARSYRNYGTTNSRWQKQQERRNSRAYREGAQSGDDISLDPQATHRQTKRLE